MPYCVTCFQATLASGESESSLHLAITASGGFESSSCLPITVLEGLKVISLNCYRREGKTDKMGLGLI